MPNCIPLGMPRLCLKRCFESSGLSSLFVPGAEVQAVEMIQGHLEHFFFQKKIAISLVRFAEKTVRFSENTCAL